MSKEIFFSDKELLLPAECDITELKEKMYSVRGRIVNECAKYDKELENLFDEEFYGLADEMYHSAPLKVILTALKTKFSKPHLFSEEKMKIFYKISYTMGSIICEEAEKNGCFDMLDEPVLYAALLDMMKNQKHVGTYQDVCVYRMIKLFEEKGLSSENIPVSAIWPLSLRTSEEQLYYYNDFSGSNTKREYTLNRWFVHKYDIDSGIMFMNGELSAEDTLSYMCCRLDGQYSRDSMEYILKHLKEVYLKENFPDFRLIAWLRGVEENDCSVDAFGVDKKGRGKIIAFELSGGQCIRVFLKYCIDISKLYKMTTYRKQRVLFSNKTRIILKTKYLDMRK